MNTNVPDRNLSLGVDENNELKEVYLLCLLISIRLNCIWCRNESFLLFKGSSFIAEYRDTSQTEGKQIYTVYAWKMIFRVDFDIVVIVVS
jgi:hypothetical protein